MTDNFLPNRSGGRSLTAAETPAMPVAWGEPEWQPSSQTLSLQGFLDALFRWRWLFVAIVAATVLTAAAWASFQTPLYRATATLELDPAPAQVIQTDKDRPVDQSQSDSDFLSLQLGLIKSRNVAEKVARGLNLGRDKAFLRREPGPGDPVEAAVGPLMGWFSASGTTSDRIMQVSFVHPNPDVAAKVANGFTDAAITSNFERALGATDRSREFLQGRLDATKRELEKSEKALIEYARAAKIINVVSSDSPTSGDSAGGTLVASNLVALNQQLADAQNARIVAQQRYAQGGAAAQAARASDSTAQALQQQKALLQSEYDQKLQTFQPDFPEMRALRARITGLDAQIAASGSRASSAVVGSLRGDMIAAQNRESALQVRINQLQSQFLDLNDRGVQYTILKRTVDANRSLYNALLAQLGVENSTGTRTSSIAVIDRAVAPGSPFSPNIPRTMILALIFGLGLGSAGVWGADRFYDTINTPEDLTEIGLALLGVIPVVPKKQALDDVLADPGSPVAEAFHSARVAIQFASAGGAPRSIMFNSAKPSEGKTSCSIAIAADFLSVGKRVVVVDADLRKPSLRGDSPGLSAVLAGVSTLSASLLESDHPRLYLLPAGHIPPNPTALLAGQAIANLLRTLESMFDVVIVDGPPVLGFADGPLLAAAVEATVIVVESRSTSRSMARNATARLEATGGNIIGGILNKFEPKSAGFSYGGTAYGYEYKYGGEAQKRSLIAPPTVVKADPEE